MSMLHRAAAALAGAHSVPAVHLPQQAAVVRSRLGLLVPLVAALTVAWILVDAAGLGAPELARTAPLRLLVALALLLVWRLRERLPMHVAIAAFVWVQALGFGALQHVLESPDAGLRLGYGLFPFVIAAQLAIFPLTWAHSLRLGIAPAALLAGCALMNHQLVDDEFASDAWLLVLILGMSAWGGHMQVRLLVELLGARRDASIDALTGLANRRFAERRMQSDRARALRHPEALSVATIDLDHFKRVNDTWGHACGDLVLVAVARALQEELRGADLGARFGGEEFLAVLPGTGHRQALRVAERIRERIGGLEIATPHGIVRVTASLGIATLEAGESIDALLARADAALYRAKAEGRNRCIAATHPAARVAEQASPPA